MYRKYFEPEYGEVDKYVKKEMSSAPEMPSMKAWRKRYNYETFTDLSLMIRDCYFAAYGSVVVVAVEYRLAPEYQFPVGLEDCYAGLEWAVKNAGMINGSTDCVTVCGDSSGGNFAAAVALVDRDRKGPKLDKQILIFPATTFHVDEPLDSIKRYNGGDYFVNYSDF